MSSLVTDSSHWRKRAAELRALADDTTDAEEKKLLLQLSADYEKLAERASRLVVKAE